MTEKLKYNVRKRIDRLRKAVVSGIVLPTDIRSLKKALNQGERPQWYKAENLIPQQQLSDLIELCGVHKPFVSQEQCEIGLKWLRAMAFTPKTDEPRTRHGVPVVPTVIRNMIKRGTHFSLVDWYSHERDRHINWYPVYRMYTNTDMTGDRFDYAAIPWQEGGGVQLCVM